MVLCKHYKGFSIMKLFPFPLCIGWDFNHDLCEQSKMMHSDSVA